MKINSLPKNNMDSNLDGDSLDFGIKDASIIIEILRNRLYSHPIRTCVQEYLCNGRDANREAGNEDKPLLVNLPTKNDPTFKVRDFGPGLSKERVKDVFVYYGSSTKRDTNKQTGGFGIGAKSAWAYTDSFVIVSYYNGIATHYLAHIGKNKNGTLEVLNSYKTEEPNGTEIQIGVAEDDFQDFYSACERATFFWDVRPSFTNKKLLSEEYHTLKPEFICKSFAIYAKKELHYIIDDFSDHSMIVIDKIPYSLESFDELDGMIKLEGAFKSRYALVFFVENGFCEVSASREAISDSADSKCKISKKANEIAKETIVFYRDYVNNAPSLEEMFVRCRKIIQTFCVGDDIFSKKVGGHSFILKCNNVSSDFLNFFDIRAFSYRKGERGGGPKFRELPANYVTILDGIHFIMTDENIAPVRIKQKVSKFLLEKEVGSIAYLLTPKKTNLPSNYKTVLQDMGAHCLSELELPPKRPSIRRGKSGTNQPVLPPNYAVIGVNKIHFGYRDCSVSHETVDLTKLSTNAKIVFIKKEEYDALRKNDLIQVKYLVEFFKKRDIAFCYMTERFINWTKSDNRFIHLNNYTQTLSPNDIKEMKKEIESSIILSVCEAFDDSEIDSYWSDSNSFCIVREFKNFNISSKIEDSRLQPLFKTVYSNREVFKSFFSNKISTHTRVPNILLNQLTTTNPTIKKNKEETFETFKYLNSKYPLLGKIACDIQVDKQVVEEAIVYMNGKFKA